MSASDSYTETEVKIRVPGGATAALAMMERAGFPIQEARTLEVDQLFDRGGGDLRNSGQILRLRRTGSRVTVTYKGPVSKERALERYKSREEIEFDVSDAETFRTVLDRLGYVPTFRYEKYRTKFAVPGEAGVVTIDETPIGVFIELEGPPEWIEQTAARLGLSPSEYLTASYSTLYEQYRQSHMATSTDMTFD